MGFWKATQRPHRSHAHRPSSGRAHRISLCLSGFVWAIPSLPGSNLDAADLIGTEIFPRLCSSAPRDRVSQILHQDGAPTAGSSEVHKSFSSHAELQTQDRFLDDTAPAPIYISVPKAWLCVRWLKKVTHLSATRSSSRSSSGELCIQPVAEKLNITSLLGRPRAAGRRYQSEDGNSREDISSQEGTRAISRRTFDPVHVSSRHLDILTSASVPTPACSPKRPHSSRVGY
ncbi:hypothetical protein BJ875DRAFT_265580 [Amylocarpus encephaloides]|uniref:Uncharacterized protein n=1 Tax=Amylocarpus encephaloides TaxID=45428 RepID=A0A9P8C6G8_9HELO|nr:hypothetical protein BJ875DRAFT_265580 [Amylocarpus encephaloides]